MGVEVEFAVPDRFNASPLFEVKGAGFIKGRIDIEVDVCKEGFAVWRQSVLADDDNPAADVPEWRIDKDGVILIIGDRPSII